MKKIFAIALLVAVMTSCNSKKEEQNDPALQDATRQELEEAVADRDSLFMLVNEISAGMDQIKQLEDILTTSGVGEEGSDLRAKIIKDMAAIQQTLKQRREQLTALEAKLKKSNLANAELKKTIETLRQQIDEQSAEISSLRSNLAEANVIIDSLSDAVDSLNETVDTVVAQRDAAERRGTELENELNTCYYVAASSKELKEHNILEGGFLRKTKLMEGDFDKSFFTKADKRNLTTINLYSKKAKVLTKQPEGSYELVDNDGQKVLRILNPASFWSLSNYLVVEID